MFHSTKAVWVVLTRDLHEQCRPNGNKGWKQGGVKYDESVREISGQK